MAKDAKESLRFNSWTLGGQGADVFEKSAEALELERLNPLRGVDEWRLGQIFDDARDGVYADARVARAEKTNLVHLRGSDDFRTFYLTCLRDAVFVDISDFEIRERRRFFGPVLVGLKTGLWKLLKFYTYRLWSQQNQVNGLVITALEGVEEQSAARIAALEKRIVELEKAAGHGRP